MNKDFRVSVTLPTHPKTLKLMKKLGDRAFYSLIRLWAFVSTNKPNGDLSGYDIDDIEIAADWTGDDGLFVNTLVDLKFLEKQDDGYHVHDWHDHNEYAAHAPERSAKAKKAARARWGNGSGKQNNENNNAKSCTEHESSNTTSTDEQCPSPIPSPTPSSNLNHNNHSANYYTEISEAIPKVDGLFKKNNQEFNAREWAVEQYRNRGHPGAILKTFENILCAKFFIENPYGLANHIMERENGNFNEKDHIAAHEELKNLEPEQLSEFTQGLIKEIS